MKILDVFCECIIGHFFLYNVGTAGERLFTNFLRDIGVTITFFDFYPVTVFLEDGGVLYAYLGICVIFCNWFNCSS